MTDLFAHQIAAKAAGGNVSVIGFRDPADGSEAFGVSYSAARGVTKRWLSPQRFTEREQADAACAVLAAFLGVEVRP